MSTHSEGAVIQILEYVIVNQNLYFHFLMNKFRFLCTSLSSSGKIDQIRFCALGWSSAVKGSPSTQVQSLAQQKIKR